MAAYLMNLLCIAGSVRSGSAQERKVTQDVINAMSFLVSIFIIFPWLLARKLFYGLFRIGERLVLKSGFKMKKPAIFVLNAAIKFSGALQNVISVKRNWIWTSRCPNRSPDVYFSSGPSAFACSRETKLCAFPSSVLLLPCSVLCLSSSPDNESAVENIRLTHFSTDSVVF